MCPPVASRNWVNTNRANTQVRPYELLLLDEAIRGISSMTYPATRELAKRIAAVHASDIGDAARAQARNAVLDTLGVILAGRGDE